MSCNVKTIFLKTIKMSKKKFIKLSEDWTKDAKTFLSNLIEDVLDENELTMEEFCGFIDVEQDEINNFLYNNGELSLLTISKLLIGSNLAVEVKHVSDTEIESYDLSGSDYEDEKETPKKMQPRDEKGRFKSYDEVEKQKNEELEEWDDEEAGFNEAMFTVTTEVEDEKDMREAIRDTIEEHPERILKLLKAIFEL